jgi:hypothetical protein
MSKYEELRKIDVSKHVEKKNDLSYLSWAWAWDTFKQNCPDAIYKIIKTDSGIPYFETAAGVMVYTQITANNETHEMWLPVMDGANKAMKSEPYTYTVRDWKTKQMVEKKVDAFTMFDVNKTLMRCLVKNIAMFGLGLYIYNGEDLPETEAKKISDARVQELIDQINNIEGEPKKTAYKFAMAECSAAGDVDAANKIKAGVSK